MEEKYPQLNGQLMGSVVSFPILCLMNLFAYWESIETYYCEKFSLKKLLRLFPVLINGDDILFKCSRSFYDHWKSVIRTYGFEFSAGKNLFCENKCTINSRYYVREDGDLYRKVDYLNHGFIIGIRKGDQTDGFNEKAFGDPFRWEYYQQLNAYFQGYRNPRADLELVSMHYPLVGDLIDAQTDSLPTVKQFEHLISRISSLPNWEPSPIAPLDPTVELTQTDPLKLRELKRLEKEAVKKASVRAKVRIALHPEWTEEQKVGNRIIFPPPKINFWHSL